ncbi:MAG: ATP-binding cassette domain-containing protein [Acidimicrobiia bacterium]|nr:ATP-binding cassette domain-containing protein [Acidimicrobiia bacterium]
MTAERTAALHMEQERRVGSGDPWLLTAICLQSAGLVSPLAVFLFRRSELAEHLNVLGAIVGEASLLLGVLIASSLLVARARDKLPAVMLCFLGGLMASVGLGVMANTTQLVTFVVGGVLVALGCAPGLLVHRVLLASEARFADRFRALCWYWAAVSLGVSLPLVLVVFSVNSFVAHLWVGALLTFVGTLLLGRYLLVHDEDVEVEPVVSRGGVPWVRRAYGLAFAAGSVVVGGADAAQGLLVGEWQRNTTQTAAVLAGGAVAAVLIGAFGPAYHRLHRLSGGRRADAVGTNLVVAGLLVSLGALSFTYIGLIACWLVAGGALLLAVAVLDASLFASLAPHVRRRVAARQVLWAGVGAALVALVNALVVGGVSDQFKVAWVGLILAGVGWQIRRFAPSAREIASDVRRARAVTMPRRVHDLNLANRPLLAVEQVSVAYGSVQVLFDVDVVVNEGAVVALLGTNGAGKTTLLRAISGLEPTIGGRIIYAGLDITKTRPTWRAAMGLQQIVGGETVIGPLTVAENLRLFGYNAIRPTNAVVNSREANALDAVYELFPRLAERSNQRADTLSGGEKQMLSLAKAIIVPPRLLLIDEFSLGLAPTVIADLLPVVRTIAAQGAAVLIVEQSVNIALAIADYAYVVEKGAIGYSGTAEELRAKPDLLRAAYLEGLAHALSVDQ